MASGRSRVARIGLLRRRSSRARHDNDDRRRARRGNKTETDKKEKEQLRPPLLHPEREVRREEVRVRRRGIGR